MNALPGCYKFDLQPEYLEAYEETVAGQRALCACTLTCRAWRVRAQYLLSIFPHIPNGASLAHFTTAVQNSPIIRLTLGTVFNGSQKLDASKASELFMHSGPHLQHLRCFRVRFDRGPPLRVLRMRLPFFADIIALRLYNCTFQSLRAMLDVVWGCPNLAMLDISGAEFKAKLSSAAGLRKMTTAMENLRACQKLTSLSLDKYTLPESSYSLSLILRQLITYCLHSYPGTPLVPD